ncbi:MAG: metal-dependent hydrolase [Flavobacteriales bacterium]
MDLLSHILSGLAVSTVVVSFANVSKKHKAVILFCGALGGGFPDFDVLSHWSGFDSTFGKWFELDLPGTVIYHEKRWYSHHAFLHSVTAAILLAFLIGGIIYLFRRKEKTFQTSLHDSRFIMLAFFLGFCAHLVEDMPTPTYAWGGVNFFWPSGVYFGGTGEIWWWNNYDLFLIIIGVVFLNALILILRQWLKFNARIATTFVLLCGIYCYLHQMKTRPFDFNYQKAEHSKVFWEYEQKSKEIQKEILGERLYGIMEEVDNHIPLWF